MAWRSLVNGLAVLALALGLFAAGAAAAVADRPVRILVLGDSLVAGYGLPAGEGFMARLESALEARGHAVQMLDGGVSGDTTAGGRARLSWALAARPDAAIVELGANDGLRGIEPAATRANLRAILERLRDEEIVVLLAGMKAPRNLGEEYAREFDAIYPELADEFDVLFYPFFLKGVALEPDLNLPDGIHPNARGVERIVAGILPLAEKLVRRARARE